MFLNSAYKLQDNVKLKFLFDKLILCVTQMCYFSKLFISLQKKYK